MRKLLLTLAVLCGTVSAWATDLSDGVYTITNVINGRGTLIAVEGQTNVGAANVTLSGYEGKSEDAMENGDKWYVFTLFGKTYLYNLANDQFIADQSGNTVQFTTAVPTNGFIISKNGEYYVINSGDYKASCCPGYNKGETVRWLSDDEAASQHLTFTAVENGETEFAEGIAAARVKVAESNKVTNVADLDNAKAYYIRSKRGALIYNSSNPTQLSSTVAYSNISNTSSAAEWAFIQKNDKYYLYSIEGKKFVGKNTEEAGRFPMQTLPLSDVQIVNSTVNDYPFVFSTDNYGAINHFNHTGAPGVANWKGNDNTGGLRSLGDDGSVHQIMAVRELTDEEIQDIEYAFTALETLTNPKTGTEYVLYDAAHKVFLDINNLTNEPGQADYNSLASLNSEKQSLYITAGVGLTWKIHTTAEGGKYLGQYTTDRQWNTKVNEDQSEFAWTINPFMEDGNPYANLQNTSGTQNGYLGNEGHANGSALYVNQTEEAKKLKLMLHEASLVYKVVTTEAAGAVVYAGKNYANGEYIFANATLTDADIAAKSVLGKEFANIAIDEENKTVTLTYTIVSNFKEGDKFLIKNRDHANDYICADFSGGKLDNSEEPTTKRISYQTKNGSNIDYRFCWELKATTHNEEQCFYLYNPYYDWYVGSITGTTSDTRLSKTEEQAGKYKIETEGDYFVFHCLTSNVSAGGQDGNFFHWYSWNYSKQIVGWQRSATASQWQIEEVTEEMESQWQNTLTSQFNNLTQHELGTGIGQYSGMPENLVEEYNALALPEEATAIEKARYCVYAIYEFGSAVDALVINQPETGFYRIKSQNGNKDARFGKYLQLKADNSGLEESTDATIRSIVYINDAKNLLHYSIGQYQNGYAAPAAVGSQADTWTITENPSSIGAYSLKASSQGNYLSDWSGIGGGMNDFNAVWTFEPVEDLPFTFKGAALGFATFNAPVAVELPEGISAYIGELNTENNTLQMYRLDGNQIPANTAVLLRKEGVTVDETVNFTVVSNVEADFGGVTNSLVGTIAAENLDDTKNCYSLQKNNTTGKVGFYSKASGTKGGFKAWLETDKAVGARVFTIIFDGEDATGIKEALGLENENVEIYDLSGRRLDKPAKGVNIIGGKTVIVR